MDYITTAPNPSISGNVVTPLGWKAEWSSEYSRYFYININTKESTWILPVSPPPLQQPQQLPQRKPVPTQPSQIQPQPHIFAPAAQRTYVENYPTPPPQISMGYFQAVSGAQVPQQRQQQYAQSPVQSQQQNPKQEFPQVSQRLHNNQPLVPVQQQQSQQQYMPLPTSQRQAQISEFPVPVHTQVAIHQQQQYCQPYSTPPVNGVQQSSPLVALGGQEPQNNFGPGIVTPNESYASAANIIPQYSQPQQILSPPPTPSNSYPQRTPAFVQGGGSNCSQHPNNVVQQQYHYPQAHVQPQYQTHQAQQPQVQSNHRTSMIGGNFMGGGMMNKMSSKFTQLQRGIGGSPSTAAHPNGKAPADWKKWAKRGAIGVAGIGALALGVDAAGDMFSGAEAFSGGGDFSGGSDLSGGGDFSGGAGEYSGGAFEGGDAAAVMDAQTAVDANAAQLGMEQMGQENALMLTDPPGTEYTVINDAQNTQAAMGLI